MRTFVLTYFCILVALLLIEVFEAAVYEWPHKRKDVSLGMHTGTMILHLAFAVWAAIVLWVR